MFGEKFRGVPRRNERRTHGPEIPLVGHLLHDHSPGAKRIGKLSSACFTLPCLLPFPSCEVEFIGDGRKLLSQPTVSQGPSLLIVAFQDNERPESGSHDARDSARGGVAFARGDGHESPDKRVCVLLGKKITMRWHWSISSARGTTGRNPSIDHAGIPPPRGTKTDRLRGLFHFDQSLKVSATDRQSLGNSADLEKTVIRRWLVDYLLHGSKLLGQGSSGSYAGQAARG
jgi:hypothetical protein